MKSTLPFKIHKPTVGILGAGQLGLLLGQSLVRYGARVKFYDPDENAPALETSKYATVAHWTDKQKLLEFFCSCDLVTYEFENVSTHFLDSVSFESKTPIYPKPHVLKITQNRKSEKEFLNQENLPCAPWFYFESLEGVEQSLKLGENFKLHLPGILKTNVGGYDGKGQLQIQNVDDLLKVPKNFFPCVLEKKLDLLAEASVIVARTLEGKSHCFPVFCNTHKDGILFETKIPSGFDAKVESQLKQVATQAAEKLNVNGLLTCEFFIERNSNKIYFNEFAPRPHNSGHVTLKATTISQFDALARILLGIPLPEIELCNASQTVIMQNILGEHVFSEIEFMDSQILGKSFDFVNYGKQEAKLGRKMGHTYKA